MGFDPNVQRRFRYPEEVADGPDRVVGIIDPLKDTILVLARHLLEHFFAEILLDSG